MLLKLIILNNQLFIACKQNHFMYVNATIVS